MSFPRWLWRIPLAAQWRPPTGEVICLTRGVVSWPIGLGFLPSGVEGATVGTGTFMVMARRGKQIEKSKSIEFEHQKYNFCCFPCDARLLLSGIRTRNIA